MDIDPSVLAQAKVAFASLCGGVTRLFFRPATTMVKTLWLLFGCVTCGYYFTPPAVRWLDLPLEDSGAVGAAIGFMGLSVAQGALTALDKFDFTKFFTGLLTLFAGKKGE